MQLTRFTDYALRVLMYLGTRPEQLSTIGEIAGRYRISENHLMKVVNHLANTGYVSTVRGKGGGMKLARAPKAIIIGRVVRDCEDSLAIVECFDPANRSCPLLPSCALKSALAEARKNFLATLDAYNLEQLVGRPMRALVRGPVSARLLRA